MAVIYRHLKPCGEVFYIGIGKTSKRPYSKKHRSKFWKDVVAKYGYEVQILKKDLSWQDACELEILLIAYYGRRDLGLGTLVNLTDGGEGCVGRQVSDETRKRMRNARLGKYVGQNSPLYGKPRSEEAIRKSAEARLGFKWSEAQRIRTMAYNKLNPRPQEVRDKISKTLGGANSYKAKKVIDVTTKIIYDCVQDAANYLNMPRTTLIGWLNGRYPNKSSMVYLENYNE